MNVFNVCVLSTPAEYKFFVINQWPCQQLAQLFNCIPNICRLYIQLDTDVKYCIAL